MPGMTDALFPPITPFHHDFLDVGQGHSLYFEQCGNPQGLPVVFLHGGPGSGCSEQHRRFFDPARYRIILFDQRGCGRSTPRGELRHNQTDLLLADIETLRRHLGVERWLVFGGSWGSSLALAYGAAQRESCLCLIIRGIFLTGRADLDWFFQQAGQFLPEAWQRLAAVAPKRRRQQLLYWLEKTLKTGSAQAASTAALTWQAYEEAAMAFGRTPPTSVPVPPDAAAMARLLDKYRLQAHYLNRRCFLGEAQVLAAAAHCRGLPCLILHGRRDLVCRPENAWRVHHTLGGSQLEMVEDAGHSPFDPAMAARIVAATRHFADFGDFSRWEPGPSAR